jgi:hypothetical protein
MLNGLTDTHVMAANNQQKRRPQKEPGFWITIILLVCLIGGLGVYIVSTYISHPASGTTHVAPASGNVQPSLNLQGPLAATIKQGQTLILQGEHFAAGDPISFSLDSSIPIKGKDNAIISVQASSAGRFAVSIPIQASDWSAGSHYIQAVDNRARQAAYFNIVISPARAPETISPNLALFIQGKPAKNLIFHAVIGQGNPGQQAITMTNTSGSPLHWIVTASADNNLDWLVIDNNHLAGNLDANSTDTIDVGALITALKSNLTAKPYTGQIVFTINGDEQLALSVELQVTDASPEIVFSPNPIIVTSGACQTASFTLINLGNTFVSWTLVPYDATKNDIQFITTDGQPVKQGEMAISGNAGDTQTLNIRCNSVSAGYTYKFTMYSGSTRWLITIAVQ